MNGYTLELRNEESLCVAVWQAVSSVSMSASVDRTLRSCSDTMVSIHCVCRPMSCNESCAGTILLVLKIHGANTMASALAFMRFASSCKATLNSGQDSKSAYNLTLQHLHYKNFLHCQANNHLLYKVYIKITDFNTQTKTNTKFKRHTNHVTRFLLDSLFLDCLTLKMKALWSPRMSWPV
jgi:hypothetical protein